MVGFRPLKIRRGAARAGAKTRDPPCVPRIINDTGHGCTDNYAGSALEMWKNQRRRFRRLQPMGRLPQRCVWATQLAAEIWGAVLNRDLNRPPSLDYPSICED